MRFIQTGRTGGDETAPYSVCDYESKTAGDFPNEVIKCEPNEFGYIEIDGHLQHRVEYKHGQLLDNIPAEWHTFAIEKIISSGGWGRMDYMIIVKKEADDLDDVDPKHLVHQHVKEEEKSNKPKSGILGQAQVVFGGAIRIEVGYNTQYPDAIIVGLGELVEPCEQSGEEAKSTKTYMGSQVHLVFPDLHSLSFFRDKVLGSVEQEFKEKMKEKQGTTN